MCTNLETGRSQRGLDSRQEALNTLHGGFRGRFGYCITSSCSFLSFFADSEQNLSIFSLIRGAEPPPSSETPLSIARRYQNGKLDALRSVVSSGLATAVAVSPVPVKSTFIEIHEWALSLSESDFALPNPLFVDKEEGGSIAILVYKDLGLEASVNLIRTIERLNESRNYLGQLQVSYALKLKPTWQLVLGGWIEDSEMRLPGPVDAGALELMPRSSARWIAQVRLNQCFTVLYHSPRGIPPTK